MHELLTIQDLGRMDYAAALELQRAAHAALVEARDGPPRPMTLFLVEHEPVITVSRRPGAAANLIASPEELRRHGVAIAETDRGGDITYHGPGQLVAYPILDLNRLDLRVHSYLRLLEEIVIEALASFGIAGARDPAATGVWVGDPPTSRKICAIGVRMSRWVSLHGLALNVTTNLDHFGLIVPCGLVGRAVTSMKVELGGHCPSMRDVKTRLTEAFMERIAALAQGGADTLRS